MRYAIAVLTYDNYLYACHQVADSREKAILDALKFLDLYHGQAIESLQYYLYEIDVEVDALVIDDETDGCVIAVYHTSGQLEVKYYQNQTSYQAILSMLGDLAPMKLVKNMKYLIEFIDHLVKLVDCKEVKCYN